MDKISAFFAMGGYAGYVWPAYALAVVVMAVVLIASIRAARSHERELEAMHRLRPARRRNRAVPGSEEVPQA